VKIESLKPFENDKIVFISA